MTSKKPRNPSPRRTAMRSRSAKNTSVACAPWNGPWRDAPTPRPRSSEGTAARSGVPSLTMADCLGRLPVCNSLIASTLALKAGSGGKKGGLAPGARAPADDPAPWAGRDGVAVARGAGGLWLGASRRAHPASCHPRARRRWTAAAARVARGHGAASSQSREPRTSDRALSAGQPELLARPVSLL